jgi:hypothetical protein
MSVLFRIYYDFITYSCFWFLTRISLCRAILCIRPRTEFQLFKQPADALLLSGHEIVLFHQYVNARCPIFGIHTAVRSRCVASEYPMNHSFDVINLCIR